MENYYINYMLHYFTYGHSVFGAIESCMATGKWSTIGWQYLMIFPRNLAMALPFQLLIVGPLLRFIFCKLFPEGKILA